MALRVRKHGLTVTEYLLFTGQQRYADDAVLNTVLLMTLVALIIVTQVARHTGNRRSLWMAILLLAIAATTSVLYVR